MSKKGKKPKDLKIEVAQKPHENYAHLLSSPAAADAAAGHKASEAKKLEQSQQNFAALLYSPVASNPIDPVIEVVGDALSPATSAWKKQLQEKFPNIEMDFF